MAQPDTRSAASDPGKLVRLGAEMPNHKPGERVAKSGVYRVAHDSHRLVHEAALLCGEQFPCCRECESRVRFELLRELRDEDVLPFRSGEILVRWSAGKGSET